jgi:hypothetical protein
MVRYIGPGFHPDSDFCDYVSEDGKRLFTAAQCKAFERDLRRSWVALESAGIEIYAVALPVQRRLLLGK